MDEHKSLAEPFEQHRAHLRGVAYRMLGSRSEADDAVQEAWLRLSRSDTSEVANLKGWLTTVVARVCLDMLRSRKARREDMIGAELPEPIASLQTQEGAEREALMADSVSLALLVVLETLAPAERLAFVLHDMLAVPFDEIASIVGRSSEATRQLASRARRRVQAASVPDAELDRQRDLVRAFLAALQSGDLDALLDVLDPDVVVRIDVGPNGLPAETRGARNWAKQATGFARMAAVVQLAMIEGVAGLAFVPQGRVQRVVKLTFNDRSITEISIVTEPSSVSQLDVCVINDA